MRPINQVVRDGVTIRYVENDFTNFLTNAHYGVNDGRRFTWQEPNGFDNEFFAIFGGGQLLEDDAVVDCTILHRINSDEFYLISDQNFRDRMELMED